MTQASACIPTRAPAVTSRIPDSVREHTARVMAQGAIASRLRDRKEAAVARIVASQDFIGHRFATAYSTIATERCDHNFQLQCWGYDAGQAKRRKAVAQYLKVIRRQISRARAERRAAVVPMAVAA